MDLGDFYRWRTLSTFTYTIALVFYSTWCRCCPTDKGFDTRAAVHIVKYRSVSNYITAALALGPALNSDRRILLE
ncbi:hypothetical protein F4814DRAFT_402378 [Daldinia grandis]|nr:hypothetical protein F4814DRAFT_402378 [Daldinia grandis]